MGFIPKTADGAIIYPGMSVYACSPFSVEQCIKVTVYCVQSEDGRPSDSNDYWCVVQENRVCGGEGCDDGNAIHVKKLFLNRGKCLQHAVDRRKEE